MSPSQRREVLSCRGHRPCNERIKLTAVAAAGEPANASLSCALCCSLALAEGYEMM